MNREQAEKLLAAMIFDDLDEASRAELLAHLQTDDELRERLADLRMAVKLAGDAVNDGPAPVLSDKRLKQLKQLAKSDKPRARIFTLRPMLGVAAVIAVCFVLAGLLMPSLSSSRSQSRKVALLAEQRAEQLMKSLRESDDEFSQVGQATLTDSQRRRLAEAKARMGLTETGAEGISNGPPADRYWSYDRSGGGGSRPAEPIPPVASLDAGSSSSIRNSLTTGEELGRLPQTRRFARGRRGQSQETLPEIADADTDGVASASVPSGQGGMGGNGGMMGGYGMGGMGGYGGMPMSTAEPEARTPGVNGRYDIQFSGGSSLDVLSGRGRSDPLLADPGPLSTPVPAPEGAGIVQMMRGQEINEQMARANRGRGGRVAANEPSFRAGRERGVRDETLAGSDGDRLAGQTTTPTPAQPEGTLGYGWWGRVAPTKPNATVAAPPAGGPVATTDDKAHSVYLGVEAQTELGKPVEADRRVPVLGDMPVVGGLFRNESRVQSDLELSKKLGQLRETAEAAVPYSDEITYPKHWKELAAKERAATALDPNNTSGVVTQMPTVDGETLRKLMEQRQEQLEAELSPSPSHFQVVPVNPWVMTERDALSTFALDVDTASYAMCRQYIRSGSLPPIGAVRMEEFINAFDYAYPQRDDATFAVYAEGAPSPFAPAGQDVTLLKIAVKARTVGRDQRRAAHIVFVVDASASMGQPDRLPLVQSTMNLLVDKLSEADRVSLVTCASDARLHLEAVSAQQRDAIRQTVEAIQPAGPTNLMAGLELGYAIARRAFVAGQINQVVLCSDGVANVGRTEAEAVLEKVADDRKQGITLTCVGVGYGAYNDAFLEALANRGDGRYVFLDPSEGAQETLVGQLAATLQTVAKDARIQVQFDPSRVRRYRLIGYENRDIEDERFRDDTIDAGEVGSGQCSTALYEMELTSPAAAETGNDLGTVFVRYRNAETGQIEEFSRVLAGSIVRRRSVEEDPRFFLAAGAARFAEWLRESEHARHTALPEVQRLLDEVAVALPLDVSVGDLAMLAHQAEGLPRASQP